MRAHRIRALVAGVLLASVPWLCVGSIPLAGANGDGGPDADEAAVDGAFDAHEGGDADDAAVGDALPADAGVQDSGDAGAIDATSEAGDAASGDASDAEASTDSGLSADAGDADIGPGAELVLLNELGIDPPSTDQPNELVELRCTPSARLVSTWFVAFDPRGLASAVLDLSGTVCGANGLVLIRGPLGRGAQQLTTTVVTWVRLAQGGAGLSNATATFAVVRGGAVVENVDYDADDDGTLELPAGASLADAVGVVVSGAAGERTYGGASIRGEGIDLAALSRLRDDERARTAAAWFGGEIVGASDSLRYSACRVLPNTPTGALLTPGAPNADGPAVGDGGAGCVPDASGPDASPPVRDAAIADAAVEREDDGSPTPANPPGRDTGCGCRTTGAASAPDGAPARVAFAALTVLAVARRRRRS